jgi:hypothetical protein
MRVLYTIELRSSVRARFLAALSKLIWVHLQAQAPPCPSYLKNKRYTVKFYIIKVYGNANF